MSYRTLTPPFASLCLCTLLLACADPDNGGSGTGTGGNNGPQTRHIAGTSAIGRPASWSLNCLDEDCVRADAEGQYQLSTVRTDSGLMWSQIDDLRGGEYRLYSRYRHQDALTSALVNINPSTDALMQARAYYQQGIPLDLCAAEASCAEALMAGFSPEQEAVMLSQLADLLAPAWPPDRDPFTDVYRADSSDPLDVLHDALQFVVTPTELQIRDNNDTLLTSIPLSRLMRAEALDDVRLLDSQYQAARQLPPDSRSYQAVTIDARVTPSRPVEAPVSASVDAGGSRSVNPGDLTIFHDLTRASGHNQRFTGPVAEARIAESGDHIWVVTAIDALGHQASAGFIISTYGAEGAPVFFGGEGSCVTPPPLTANSLNICQEVQNGTELGPCDEISSLSINLIRSPAACPHERLNDGDLLGVCTVSRNELRTFYYQNPERYIATETFAEQQARVAEQCASVFSGVWSVGP